MPASHRSIARIDAFVIVGDKDYVAGAGLRPVDAAGPRALAQIGDLHVCAYPPQAQSCLVRITADDGTVGWGEAHAPLGPRATKAVVEDVLAPLLLGGDPLAIEHHWARMYGSMRLRGHVAGFQLEAIAGVDIALWDLAGKLLDVPVYRLLGGPFRTELPVYASGVPGRTIQERVASAEQFVAQGYTAVKASIGRGDIDADLAGLEALARACADARTCWSMRTAPTPPTARCSSAASSRTWACTGWRIRCRRRTSMATCTSPPRWIWRSPPARRSAPAGSSRSGCVGAPST